MRIPSGTVDQYICAKCEQIKSKSQFHRDRKTKRGFKYACKECVNQDRRGRYSEDNRRYHLKSKYGITPEQYQELANQQNWRCAICNETGSQRSGGQRAKNSERLFVDHDHVTEEVRGLLCHRCNVAVGLMCDDPQRLERAAKYIRGMPVEYLVGAEK